MLTWIDRVWSVNDRVNYSEITAVVAISYAATDRRLTRASEGVAQEVVKGWERAPIFWGVFSEQSRRRRQVEFRKKTRTFDSAHRRRHYAIGLVSSSTDECESVIRTAFANGVSLEKVLVVAWGPHSRRDRLVWKYMLKKHVGPTAKVYFRSLSGPAGEDAENPMKLQRSWKVWFLTNLILFPFFKFLPGVGWFARQNFHQPAS